VEYNRNTFAFRLRGLISGDDAERRCGGRLKTLGECRRRRRHGRYKLAVNVVDRVAGVGGRAHVAVSTGVSASWRRSRRRAALGFPCLRRPRNRYKHGRIYSMRGPVQKKMWRPLMYECPVTPPPTAFTRQCRGRHAQ